MSHSKFPVLAFLCIPFLISGCNFHADSDQGRQGAKAYYRDFNSESLFSLSEDALISAENEKFEFERKNDIEAIEKLISIPCARKVRINVNARLVIHFLVDGKKKRSWVASRFYFYDSKYDRVCELPEGVGESIVLSLRNIGSNKKP